MGTEKLHPPEKTGRQSSKQTLAFSVGETDRHQSGRTCVLKYRWRKVIG